MNYQKYPKKIKYFFPLIITLFLNACVQKREPIDVSKDKKQVDKYYQLANNYYDNNKYDSAFYYSNKIRLDINPKLELKKYATNMFIIVASQQMKGDYAGAENSIVEALNSFERINKKKYKYKFYNLLAYNYMSQKIYSEARFYYKKTATYYLDKRRKLLSVINIGHTYKEEKQYKKALNILLPLLKDQTIQNHTYYKAGILNDIGYCYFKLGNTIALSYLKKSLKLFSNMDSTADNNYDITANYYNLHEYYLEKDKKTALHYAKLLYQKATEYNNPDDRLIALSLLIKNTEGSESKKYALKYISLNDSITDIRQKAKNFFAKLKFDSKKEKEENIKLKTERELLTAQERNKNIITTFVITILLIITGIIYYYLIEKNKKEKLQTAYNTETRIAKKLHDELANEIYQTINFAETQDLSSPNVSEKLLENLDNIYATTRNISRENNYIETEHLFSENLKEMIASFNSKTTNIIINGLEELDWSRISKLKKITIYRVIQELLVNMKKHSKSTLVLISFKRKENKLHVNYYDNGIGIDFEKPIKKNGLQNIENRISTINGKITFEKNQNKGLKSNITIPT